MTGRPSTDAPDDDLRDCRGEGCVQVTRERMMQIPGDRHGLLADVTPIRSRSKKPKGSVVGPKASEQHDRSTLLLVIPVAQSRSAVGASARLALPVDAGAANCVVPVSRLRREAAAALVES